MCPKETFLTAYGDMISMINCIAIDRGLASQKKKWKFDDVIALR